MMKTRKALFSSLSGSSLALCLLTNCFAIATACGPGKVNSFYQDQFRIIYRQLPPQSTADILQIPQRAVIRVMVSDAKTLESANKNTITWLVLLASYCSSKEEVDSLENANDFLTKAMELRAASASSEPHSVVSDGPDIKELFEFRATVLRRLNRSAEIDDIRRQFALSN